MNGKYCQRPDCGTQLRGKQARWCSTACASWARNQTRQRRASLIDTTASVGGESRLDKLTRIEQLLADADIPLEEIGAVKAVRLNEWTALAKGEMVEDPETGKKHRDATKVVDMRSASILLHPSWATGPKWELPHPPTPITVKVPKAQAVPLVGTWKTALILPDPQFGYRRDLHTDHLDPFHDVRALSVALGIAEVERPDLTIWLGDVLDFASFGKYRQEAGFALTVQPTIEVAHHWISLFAALTGESRFIEGNHDVRLQNQIIDNAKAAFGIKRAGAPPEEWPVMSVPFLLRLDELGVRYIGGYPAGATYINDNVAAIHGVKTSNATRSAATMVVEDERVSVVYGHVHGIETRYRTRNTRGNPKFSFAHSPGCLCRIDGAVPGTKSGIDAFGRAVKSWENWQNGVAIIRYQEGDGKYALESIPIIEGEAVHRGQEFTSD